MNKVSSAHVLAAHHGRRKSPQYGGGPAGTLRAYQAFHPNAAIYTVTYRGRTVWMTSRQRAIWSEVQHYWRRGRRDTLGRIAKVVGCHRTTVLRFLRRLDLWRFIDLATLPGLGGGTYIFTRIDPYNEKPQKWTSSKRQRIRDAIGRQIRKQRAIELEPLLSRFRRKGPLPAVPPWWTMAIQTEADLTGSTGATFRQPK